MPDKIESWKSKAGSPPVHPHTRVDNAHVQWPHRTGDFRAQRLSASKDSSHDAVSEGRAGHVLQCFHVLPNVETALTYERHLIVWPASMEPRPSERGNPAYPNLPVYLIYRSIFERPCFPCH